MRHTGGDKFSNSVTEHTTLLAIRLSLKPKILQWKIIATQSMLVTCLFILSTFSHKVVLSTAIDLALGRYNLREDASPEYVLPLHVTCDLPNFSNQQSEPLFNSFLMDRQSVHGAYLNGQHWTSKYHTTIFCLQSVLKLLQHTSNRLS